MWKDRRRFRNRIQNSRLLVKIAKYSFIGVIVLVLGFFVVLPLMAFNLPSPDKVVRRDGFSTKILDRNGVVLYDIYNGERRSPVTLSEIPLYLRQATISIEDKNFYKHQGFDPLGLVRAFYYVVRYGRSLQGGSTLTQQLVKNVLFSSERSVIRKAKEFVLAIQIERKYTKDQILQMYLNEAPYGGTAWGVEAASEVYFGKKVKDINLVESAILAGLPQRPSVYSPFSSNPKAFIPRTQAVFRRMREDGYITSEQEKEANSQLSMVQFQSKGAGFKAPHFVQYVQKILEDRYGENVVEQGGLKVTTTLDYKLQEKAQNIVSEEITKVEKQHITNGAAVVVNPQTGEILAMVGSKNFSDPNYDGQFNVVTALRQPGSAIKPITYVTAFKEGYTPSTLLMDVPTTFPGGAGQPDYKPVNYDGKFKGPIQVRYALGNSINLPAVKMLAMVGIKDALQTAYDLGINSLKPDQTTLNRVGLSLTLGGGEVKLLELTGAYGAFMNKGYRIDPISILKVEDNSGKVLEEVKPKVEKRVLTEAEAFLIANILSDNSARKDVFGENSLLNIPGRTVAVKTGTTNDKKDNWTIGGNTQSLVGVWVGNNNNTSMLNVASGISGASPIWRRILLESLSGKPDQKFEIPAGVVTASVDSVSGYRSHDGFTSRTEYFIKGTEPGDDPIHMMLKVCKSDGKLATPSDIAGGNYDTKEFFVFKEEDPTAGSGQPNKWQEGILNWLGGQSDSRYHPPSDFCGTQNPVNVDFISPIDRASNLDNSFLIKFRADSTNDIVSAGLEVDGKNVRNYDSMPFEYQIDNLSTGVHTIKAIAKDSSGNQSDRNITVGVKVAWDFNSSPSPSSSPTPTP